MGLSFVLHQLPFARPAATQARHALGLTQAARCGTTPTRVVTQANAKKRAGGGGQSKEPRDVTERLVAYCAGQGVERDVAGRVVEMAQRALRDWSMGMSEFLTPVDSETVMTAVSSLAEVRVVAWGGYPEAERRAVMVAHAETVASNDMLQELASERLRLLKIEGDFGNSKATHRDFLGAVLNCGISRQKVGDLMVLESRGAHVIVHEDVAEFVRTEVTSVRDCKVRVENGAMDELELGAKRIKEVQSVESSTRLDAVVSAGLNVSRSRLADMVRGGLVQLNYKETRSPAKTLKSGDVVSVRGVGKLEIAALSTTNKGRFRIQMNRFL